MTNATTDTKTKPAIQTRWFFRKMENGLAIENAILDIRLSVKGTVKNIPQTRIVGFPLIDAIPVRGI
jgi:hypothetical protein